MKIALRDRLEKALLRYNIYLWNPGISKSPNSYVGGSYFIDSLALDDLIRVFRTTEEYK